jgi:hypothetical protein
MRLFREVSVISETFLAAFFTFVFFASGAWAQAQLKYSKACSPEQDIEISAVGDVLLHSPLQIQATRNNQRFISLWSEILPMFERADLSYANLEGPSAPGVTASGRVVQDPGFTFDGKVYSSYPQFNYHPFLIEDLKTSGLDIVSTANNHALDRHSTGVDLTIQNLDLGHLLFTGTQSSKEQNRPWHVITEAKGRRIAWLACTFSTNGISDRYQQVLLCYENPKELFKLVSDLSKDPDIDAVIVTPHWGEEYQHTPHASQTWLGRQLIEAGATAVIGTHPHVVQTWEKYNSKDGREAFIMYSTGNFVSGQAQVARRTSVLIQLHLTSKANEKLQIRGVQFLPLLMQTTSRGLEVMPIYQYGSSVPSESLGIWRRFFHEAQRVHSPLEDAPRKICRASQDALR